MKRGWFWNQSDGCIADPPPASWSSLAAIRQLAAVFRDASDTELSEHADRLRLWMLRADDDEERQLQLAAALAAEALRRSRSIELYDVQLLAGLQLARGHIVEMHTGEGKTFAATIPAVARSLSGRGVHVVTANTYLAARDHALLAPAFQLLGLRSGVLLDEIPWNERRAIYSRDIVYGPGYAFGFDYLRDQLALRQATQNPLSPGEAVLRRLRGENPSAARAQRQLHFAIIDEIDQVLIDDSLSPLVISGGGNDDGDARLYRSADDYASGLQPQRDYMVDHARRHCTLTAWARERLYERLEPNATATHQRRPWHRYIETALAARNCYIRDADYVVFEDRIAIIDHSTGRVLPERTWQDGIHQAIEAKEDVTITAEQRLAARITRQRFFGYYDQISGMSGTLGPAAKELQQVYGATSVSIPLRIPSRRENWKESLHATREEKRQAMAREAIVLQQQGRPVLIGTLSVEESQRIAASLAQAGADHRLLNGIQDESEASLVARAGQSGMITVATNLAGRGTDIPLTNESRSAGGLHVIVGDCHRSRRVDRQLIGRCARQGDPGSARFFLSAEDPLIVHHAPWLANAMRRTLCRNNASRPAFLPRIQAVQRRLERRDRNQRLQLWHAERKEGQRMSKGHEPADRLRPKAS